MRNGGPPNEGNSMGMGLETDLAAQEQVQGGLDPFGDTGRDYSTEKQRKISSDSDLMQNFMKNAPKGFKKEYMQRMLTEGLASKLQRDAQGNLTGLYSKNRPTPLETMKLDPVGTIAKAMMPGPVGLITGLFDYFNTGDRYTGYNPKITTQEDMNDGSDYNPLIKIANDRLKPVINKTAASLYNQNPNQYTLNVSGINSLRNR